MNIGYVIIYEVRKMSEHSEVSTTMIEVKCLSLCNETSPNIDHLSFRCKVRVQTKENIYIYFRQLRYVFW